MGKYVAVGVLAVIVLATVTYEPPEKTLSKRAPSSGQQFQGTFGEAAPTPPAPPAPAVAPPLPQGPAGPVVAQPEEGAPAASEAAPAAEQVQEYTVQRGQTLSDIAQEVLGDRARWKELYEQNKDRLPDPNTLREGVKLVYGIARQAAGKLSDAAQPQPTVSPGPAPVASPPVGQRTYVVAQGDTLYSIARRELGQGNRWREIVELNRLPSEHVGSGTVLRLPVN